jgi:hypothetical protein
MKLQVEGTTTLFRGLAREPLDGHGKEKVYGLIREGLWPKANENGGGVTPGRGETSGVDRLAAR